MRDWINLFEAPYQLDQDDFAVGHDMDQPVKGRIDDRANVLSLARQLLRAPHDVLEENPRYTLGVSRGSDAGEYFLISQPGFRVTFHNSYEVHVFPGLGRTATQKIVEKRNPNYKGIVQRVVLTYMVDEFDAVMADNDQTPQGREMWLRLMIEGINQGLCVGVYEENSGQILPFDPNGPDAFMEWIESPRIWPWGREDHHYYLRPYITKHHPARTA